MINNIDIKYKFFIGAKYNNHAKKRELQAPFY